MIVPEIHDVDVVPSKERRGRARERETIILRTTDQRVLACRSLVSDRSFEVPDHRIDGAKKIIGT
jgi:hypothetical protein